jgi:hypothetical protein
MTDEVTKPNALATVGASVKDTNAGEGIEGVPKLPVDLGNEKPKVVEGLDERHAEETPEQKAKKEADAATEKAAAEAKDKADKEAIAKQYGSMDHEGAQAAIDVLKEAGVPAAESDKFFEKAFKTGKLEDIDWAALETRVGKTKAYLIKAGVTQYHADETAKTAETVKATHELYGGKENWERTLAWAKAKEKTDPEFIKTTDEIRDMLAAGGTKALAGGRELLRLYNADANTTSLNTTLVVGDTIGKVIGTPLSRTEYLKEVKAAHERGASPQEHNALGQRRHAGIVAGL